MASPTGRTVSRHRILEKPDGGVMGVVYRAGETTHARTAAPKLLPPSPITDPQAQERFIREARVASRLDHPSILTVHEIAQTGDGLLCTLMACCEGETLKNNDGPWLTGRTSSGRRCGPDPWRTFPCA